MQSQPRQALREKVAGERGIYRRRTSDGVVRYEFNYVASDGRQRWKTVASLAEAKQERARLVGKDRNERIAPSRQTFGEYADAWLDREKVKLRPGTYQLYLSHLENHIKPAFGRRRLGDVSVDDVANLIAAMQTAKRNVGKREVVGYATDTIKAVLNVVSRVFGSAARRGLIASNPVLKLERGERPQSERREFPDLDRETIGRLIRAVPERYRAVVAFSTLTGIRQSEVLGLRWKDVDTRAGVVAVRVQLDRTGKLVEPKTKTAKRDIPITPDLARMLQAHKRDAFSRGFAKPDDFVFASDVGTPLQHRNLSRRGLAPAFKAIGMTPIRWHDLRHVAASAMIASGMDDDDLAPVLGHADATITKQTYKHEFEKVARVERTREGMQAAFGEVLR